MSYLYLALFFFTPLLFTTFNSELFELPKMYFIYSLTSIIFFLHLANVFQKKVTLFPKKNILFFSFFLFLTSQIVTTFFSIDPQLSFFGYYSRLNGGLLSTIVFFLLFSILSIYITDKLRERIINISLISGIFIAVYGILQHFGIDSHYWVQDVRSRVFSTLGQPNWLAAYLCILLPFSLYKLKNSSQKQFLFYFFLFFIFSLCLLFTKSKSGIIASLVTIPLYLFLTLKDNLKTNLLIFSVFTILLFTVKSPFRDKIFPPTSKPVSPSNINITASEDIRKIVWQGSLSLWQQYPILGTGPETFAFTYYGVRPKEHNLTSEWEFLYNKVHNEYLNYLANTGVFGLLTYLLFITLSLVILAKSKSYHLLAAFISILITNSTGFSITVTNLYLFVLPVLAIPSFIEKQYKNNYFFLILFLLLSVFPLSYFSRLYLADVYYQKSVNYDQQNYYLNSLKNIEKSVEFSPKEPIYLSQLATIQSKLAVTQKNDDYLESAKINIDKALELSPFNVNLWKDRSQIYLYLASVDKKYYVDAIDSLYKLTLLTPTDARNFYLLANIFSSINNIDDAISYYKKAIDLKSNYDHAYFALGKIYFDQKKYNEAKENFTNVLHYAPDNIDAQNYLKQITDPHLQ